MNRKSLAKTMMNAKEPVQFTNDTYRGKTECEA